jgi:hypothetical protein
MPDTFSVLILDLAKSLIPALVYKYEWDKSILMYHIPLLLVLMYIGQYLFVSFQLPWFSKECTVTLRHTIASADRWPRADRNYYYAVVYHLITHTNICGNYLVASATSFAGNRENTEHMVAMQLALSKTLPIRITFNQTALRISGHYTEQDKLTYMYLTITGPNIKIIRQFMHQCHDEYEDMLRSQSGSKLSTFILDGDQWARQCHNSTKSFQNLYIDASIKHQIRQDLTMFLASESRYRQLGVPYKRGYLFYGVPGTGKSSSYYAMADLAKYNIYKLTIDPSSSIKTVKHAIAQIPPKSILVIDDVDRIPFTASPVTKSKPLKSSSDSTDEAGSGQFNLQNLLAILDGYEYLDNCLVVMTSNYKEKLDPALIRSGRIDLKIEISYPNEATVNEMFQELYTDAVELNWPTTCHIPMADLIQHVVLPNSTFAEARKSLHQLIESSPASSPASSQVQVDGSQSGELIELIENHRPMM